MERRPEQEQLSLFEAGVVVSGIKRVLLNIWGGEWEEAAPKTDTPRDPYSVLGDTRSVTHGDDW